jgi:hypothetical protein
VARENRDYKVEYKRRISRGLVQGLTHSQARGHPAPAEPLATKATAKVPYNARLEMGFKALKQGKTLTEAAKEVRVAPERLRHYLGSQGVGHKVRGRWMAGPDNRKRHMLLYSKGEAITVIVSPLEASRVAGYMGAVGVFLETHNPVELMPFLDGSVTDLAGEEHPFEVNPKALYRLSATGNPSFHQIYDITR